MFQHSNIKVRLMAAADLHTVIEIQALAYADYFLEPADIIHNRFITAPHSAWVAEIDNHVCAYLVGYLSTFGKINPLHGNFSTSLQPDCLYLHDLAISPSGQGKGIGKHLLYIAENFARVQGYKKIALLSVQNSKTFWEKCGFQEVRNITGDQRENIKAYCVEGQEAFYMSKNV